MPSGIATQSDSRTYAAVSSGRNISEGTDRAEKYDPQMLPVQQEIRPR